MIVVFRIIQDPEFVDRCFDTVPTLIIWLLKEGWVNEAKFVADNGLPESGRITPSLKCDDRTRTPDEQKLDRISGLYAREFLIGD